MGGTGGGGGGWGGEGGGVGSRSYREGTEIGSERVGPILWPARLLSVAAERVVRPVSTFP